MATSHVSLFIDMPADQNQYRLVESCIQDLIHAVSPEQIQVLTAASDSPLSPEQAHAFLLYLAYQYYVNAGISLPAVTKSFFCTGDTVRRSAPSCRLSRKWIEETFLHIMTEQMEQNSLRCSNPYVTERAVQLIAQRFHRLSLEELAGLLGLNHSYLCRLLTKDTGCSFLELLHCRRILAVVKEFVDGASPDSIESLCLQIGYTSIHHFHRVFKQYTGLTPANARRLLAEYKFKAGANLP